MGFLLHIGPTSTLLINLDYYFGDVTHLSGSTYHHEILQPIIVFILDDLDPAYPLYLNYSLIWMLWILGGTSIWRKYMR
jgi:hypothetical protein